MKREKETPDWRMYERFVASLFSSRQSDSMTVAANVHVVGAISGVRRQLDVLIDSRLSDDATRRVIVDAKCRNRKIDVTDVEAFEAMMRDCRANHGILVCPVGFTEAAKRRAQQHIGLRLARLEDLERTDLSAWERCRGACSSSSSARKRKGWVLYDQPFGLAAGDSPLSVLVIGKCDECCNFHVWCWTCGSKFALADEAEHHCGCNLFWLTAIEEEGEENGTILCAVHLLLINEAPFAIIPVDRRPLA